MLERIHVPTLPFLTIKPTSSHLSVANNNISDDKVSEISKVELGNNGDMEVVWSGPPRLEGCAKPSIYL